MMPLTKLPPSTHNNPPHDVDLLREKLQNENAKALNHAQLLIDAANRVPQQINDEETLNKAADLIKQIMARRKDLESTRVDEKEPYLTLSRAVDGFFKAITDNLDAAKTNVKRPMDEYLNRKAVEERRRRIEEAEAIRAKAEAEEAAARALENAKRLSESEAMIEQAVASDQAATRLEKHAEAKPAELARTRSDAGSLTTLRTRWVGKLADVAALDLETLRHHLSPDALQKAINSYVVAGGRELRGATISEISEAVVR